MDQSDSHNQKAPPPKKKKKKLRGYTFFENNKVHNFTVGLKKMWFFITVHI